ncbi:hypothetical protein PG996_007761 [Apiospora saccharicola]|uniref:Uncharacterized protein n=1 Tax=Apiospora saccharicola TaxID=335842 RepID=A0ABR1VBS2_9PEZI
MRYASRAIELLNGDGVDEAFTRNEWVGFCNGYTTIEFTEDTVRGHIDGGHADAANWNDVQNLARRHGPEHLENQAAGRLSPFVEVDVDNRSASGAGSFYNLGDPAEEEEAHPEDQARAIYPGEVMVISEDDGGVHVPGHAVFALPCQARLQKARPASVLLADTISPYSLLAPIQDSPLFRSSAATQYPRRAASVAGRWEFLNAFVEDRRWQMDKQTPPK